MSTKTWVWIGLFIGSTVGGYIPALFGAGLLSVWGIVGSTIGAFIGIWVGYRLGTDYFS